MIHCESINVPAQKPTSEPVVIHNATIQDGAEFTAVPPTILVDRVSAVEALKLLSPRRIKNIRFRIIFRLFRLNEAYRTIYL
jgi:hypothetical protein